MRCSSFQDARRERLRRVVGLNRHRGLADDGSAVELTGHEVHRRPGHLDAVRQRLLLRVDAGERGQQ